MTLPSSSQHKHLCMRHSNAVISISGGLQPLPRFRVASASSFSCKGEPCFEGSTVSLRLPAVYGSTNLPGAHHELPNDLCYLLFQSTSHGPLAWAPSLKSLQTHEHTTGNHLQTMGPNSDPFKEGKGSYQGPIGNPLDILRRMLGVGVLPLRLGPDSVRWPGLNRLRRGKSSRIGQR